MTPALRCLESPGGIRKFVWEGLETLSLDACLRPLAWAYGGKLYRRGLDGHVKEIERISDERYKLHQARSLTRFEGQAMLETWFRRLDGHLPERWLADLRDDERRFAQLFEPVSILPPDQYRALVLQPVTGCSWNRCRFCALYRDRPHKTMSVARFAQHLENVLNYFGPALPWRRGVFLGDANAGGVAQTRLLGFLRHLRERFPTALRDPQGQMRHPQGFERVSAFLDTFTGRGRTREEWRELRQEGLQVLHLGVESGSDEVAKLLGKPSTAARVRQRVEDLKAAGLSVSLIVILGAGGRAAAAEHEQRTIELVNSLPLDGTDRIYLSELLVHAGGEYESLRLEPLTRHECRQQGDRLKEGFCTAAAVSLYDVRQFVYH